MTLKKSVAPSSPGVKSVPRQMPEKPSLFKWSNEKLRPRQRALKWLSRRAALPAGHRHRLVTMQCHPTPSRVVTMKVSVPTHCVPSHGSICITARAN